MIHHHSGNQFLNGYPCLPGLPLFRTAYTYFNITQSPLIPAFIKGSVSKVALLVKSTPYMIVEGDSRVGLGDKA